MADKEKKVVKDPQKAYDANDIELVAGDPVLIRGTFLDLAKTDAGADIRVRIHSTDRGYCPIVAVHGSQVEKVE